MTKPNVLTLCIFSGYLEVPLKACARAVCLEITLNRLSENNS